MGALGHDAAGDENPMFEGQYYTAKLKIRFLFVQMVALFPKIEGNPFIGPSNPKSGHFFENQPYANFSITYPNSQMIFNNKKFKNEFQTFLSLPWIWIDRPGFSPLAKKYFEMLNTFEMMNIETLKLAKIQGRSPLIFKAGHTHFRSPNNSILV